MATDAAALRRAVHAACRRLGLDEELRRAVQLAVTGKASMREMDGDELARLRAHLDRLEGPAPAPVAGKGRRPAARHAYQRKIYALWGELKRRGVWREPDVRSLWRFCARVLGHGPKAAREDGVIGLVQPDALGPDRANMVIEALKRMGDYAGLPPGWSDG